MSAPNRLLAAAALGSISLAASAQAQANGTTPTQISETQTAELPPLYAAELERARGFLGEMMAQGVIVPQPKDPGGGYTHEQHKRNYRAVYLAGQLFRISGDTRYRDYARDILLAYADIYPSLPDHPARKNQNPGRIFWQVLNDAVWLVHSVQGYGDIRATLSDAERERIDSRVFRTAAHFLSVESQKTFDRIHNHATWATAGVGMTGYLLDDQDMVARALLGSDKSGDTGFMRQTELLFSPDGYYTEGPYYQRYALMPFMVFGDAIARNDPGRRIFEHRDGILLKALRATIQLTYDGYFFPFNDAIRDKSLNTDELYHGVAIAYAQTRNPALLDIARHQGRTILSQNGLQLSRDLAAGMAEPFPFRSLLFTDGPEGDQGAVAILRRGEGAGHTALVAKNASQGMGHGHFDKLSWQLYDNENEIIRDYGAARFLNIVAKEGGRYLPENESWAKQTVAHNTLVVDETSHFGGEVKPASAIAPEQTYFSDQAGLQISSAKVAGTYPGVMIHRTLVMADVPGLAGPTVFDIVRADAAASHLYDLPLHYSGHIMELDFDPQRNVETRPVLGSGDGYQHIWVDGRAQLDAAGGAVTWLLDGRFYTYRFASDGPFEAILGESGANDPAFNLRREPLVILRARREQDAVFASVLEAHGLYDGATEQTVGSRSRIAALAQVSDNGRDALVLTLDDASRAALAISHDPNPDTSHTMTIAGKTVGWTGYAAIVPLEGAGE